MLLYWDRKALLALILSFIVMFEFPVCFSEFGKIQHINSSKYQAELISVGLFLIIYIIDREFRGYNNNPYNFITQRNVYAFSSYLEKER